MASERMAKTNGADWTSAKLGERAETGCKLPCFSVDDGNICSDAVD